MGTYTTVGFSVQQQSDFGIDEPGMVVDKAKFKQALRALQERKESSEQSREERHLPNAANTIIKGDLGEVENF